MDNVIVDLFLFTTSTNNVDVLGVLLTVLTVRSVEENPFVEIRSSKTNISFSSVGVGVTSGGGVSREM